MKLQKVYHMGIPVDNLDRAKDFYTKILGMEYLGRVGGNPTIPTRFRSMAWRKSSIDLSAATMTSFCSNGQSQSSATRSTKTVSFIRHSIWRGKITTTRSRPRRSWAAFTAVSSATVATPFTCSTPKEIIWSCIFPGPAAGDSGKRTDGNRRIYFTTKDAKSTKFRDENYSDLRALRAFVVNPAFSFWLKLCRTGSSS